LFLGAALVALTLPPPRALAAPDKTLHNVKGSVSYESAAGTQRPLAPHASISLEDNASAITGDNSLGGIVLPDSSRIVLGSNSKVKLVSFNQAAIASANFVVAGKVRFKVEHPNGSRANYTFQTPTAQIAVRGTEGDILSDPLSGNVQINVYQLSDPSLPVQVTLSNGQVFTLAAGQSLTISAAAGVISGTVSTVSQTAFQPFQEFGAPSNATSFGITSTVGDVTTTTITTGAAGAAGAAGAVGTLTTIAGAIIGTFVVNTIVHTVQNITSPHTSAPPPPPAPSPSPNVPIVIH
jgi:hypothetical protein